MSRLWMAVALAGLLTLSNEAVAKDRSAPTPKLSKAENAENAALTQASLYILQRRFDKAVALIDPVIAAHDAQALGEKRQMFSARSVPEMMDYMLGAANRRENSVVMAYSWGLALYLKAYVLIEMKRGEEAKLFLDRAVALSPNNAQFLGELGEWYKARGQLDEATAIFKRAEIAAEFSPDANKSLEKARAMRGIGWVAVEQGRFDEAEALFRQCLTINPDDQMAKNELDYIAQQRSKAMQ